nr:uncharacterized protein LOC123762818 [Procambarus clarkii]
MHLIILIIAIMASTGWTQQYFVRRDGMPIIFGGDSDKTMARGSGNLVVTPGATSQPRPSPQKASVQQLVFAPPQLQRPLQTSVPQPQFITPSLQSLTPVSSLCNPIAKPLVDEVQDGKAYHFSWCHDAGRTYTWEQANYYCSGLGNGFQAVTIESQRKQDIISTYIIAHYISDIWTCGNKHNSGTWSWLSGVSSSYSNWSRTGRRGLPQPDNDEGNENCLAVLNNHYNDGITWHDSTCSRLRRVICEAPQFYLA